MEIKPVQIQSLSFSIPQRIVKGVQVACLLSFVLPAFAAADSNDLLTVRGVQVCGNAANPESFGFCFR